MWRSSGCCPPRDTAPPRTARRVAAGKAQNKEDGIELAKKRHVTGLTESSGSGRAKELEVA